MKIGKSINTHETLMIEFQQRVKNYTHLGMLRPKNNEYTAEIKTKFGKAHTNFVGMRKMLCRSTELCC